MGTPELNDLQKDALKEVGNIGAGHAATALSQLLSSTIKITEPHIEVTTFGKLTSEIGDENIVAAIHMFVEGDAPGHMVVLFKKENAFDFVNIFLKRIVGEVTVFDSMVDSTLKEFANIIAGSYLTALMELTGMRLLPSVPTLAYGGLQTALLALMPVLPDQDMFLIDTGFLDDAGLSVSGKFIMTPESGSLKPLLSVFGVD